MGDAVLGMELNVVGRTSPEEALVGEQIVDLVGFVRGAPGQLKRGVDDAGVGVPRIQQYRHQEDVVARLRCLREKEDVVALRRVEPEVAELVERPVFFADAVELGDELLDVARRVLAAGSVAAAEALSVDEPG